MSFFKRVAFTLIATFIATSLVAQDAADLERRLRELEQKITQLQTQPAAQPQADLAEIQRQIEILGREVEALKTRQTDRVALADQSQMGLGAAASKVYRVEQGLSFGGYGEMLYENYDKRTDAGGAASARDKFDMLRGVLYTGYKYNDRILLNSEIEYEHGSTGLGGEVSVEFAYLDFLIRPDVGIRTGLLLIPMGLANEQHEPTTYLPARRATSESAIIPTTWREMGAGVFGETGPFSWRIYAVNSIRGDKFSSGGLRGGRQKGANALIEDIAFTGRLDWEPIVGTTVGASFFTGETGQNSMVGGETVGGRLNMFDIHAETQFRGAIVRGLLTRATLDDVTELNALNNLTGNKSIGESLAGWYLEAGYDLAALRGFGQRSLTPYIRYERVDTQRRVPTGFTRNPATDQTIFTYGIQFRPIPQTVIKADYQNIDNEAGTGLDQWNIGIGYIF